MLAVTGIFPQIGITKTHVGNFTQSQQNATYTVTISNPSGASPTSGTVSMTETIPSGLSLVSMIGSGWTCAANTCSRTDALLGGASYPTIAVTVDVNANATSPQVNMVSLSMGGVPVANATDSTNISLQEVRLF